MGDALRVMISLGLLWGVAGCNKAPNAPAPAPAPAATTARVELLGGSGVKLRSSGRESAATVGAALAPGDEIVVPKGEFLVVRLGNGYLVKVDEDTTIKVEGLANFGAPPATESVASQLDRLLTTEEKGRAERVAGAQARQASARAVAPQEAPSAPAPAVEEAPSEAKLKPKAPKAEAAAPPPPPAAERRSRLADKPSTDLLKALGSKNEGGSLGDVLGNSGSGAGSAGGLGGLGTRGSGAGGTGAGIGSLGSRGKERAAEIEPATPTVQGALEPELIRRVIRTHGNEIRFCYERQLEADPTLEGKLVVGLVIGKDGSVVSATVKESTVSSPALGQCVVARVRGWQFPTPKDGVVTVTYPFVFKRPDGPAEKP